MEITGNYRLKLEGPDFTFYLSSEPGVHLADSMFPEIRLFWETIQLLPVKLRMDGKILARVYFPSVLEDGSTDKKLRILEMGPSPEAIKEGFFNLAFSLKPVQQTKEQGNVLEILNISIFNNTRCVELYFATVEGVVVLRLFSP